MASSRTRAPPLLLAPKILTLVRAALSGRYVFHGSPTRIDGELQPSPTSRKNNGVVVYDAVSLHATPLLYVSLSYLAVKTLGYASGGSLHEPENELSVMGPPAQSKDSIVQRLFGRGGYVYVLPADRFTTFAGLGRLEVASTSSVAYERRVHLTHGELLALLGVLGVRVKRVPMRAPVPALPKRAQGKRAPVPALPKRTP